MWERRSWFTATSMTTTRAAPAAGECSVSGHDEHGNGNAERSVEGEENRRVADEALTDIRAHNHGEAARDDEGSGVATESVARCG